MTVTRRTLTTTSALGATRAGCRKARMTLPSRLPPLTLRKRRLRRMSLLRVTALVLALLAATATSAVAKPLPGAKISATQYVPSATYPGLQHLHYKYGPVDIVPGQNTIDFGPNNLKPTVPGYITRFSPNLVYAGGKNNGKVPRVDVIHLHHGVWVMDGYPTFAAGEEKTVFNAPQGYGYHYKPSDGW